MATNLLAGISTARIIKEATLLNAVTATGAGTAVSPGFACSHYSWHIVVTGAPTAVSVTLEVSNDGGNSWQVVDTSTTTTEEIRHITGKDGIQVRANLGTLTGGTTPTVTVKALLGAIAQV